MGETAGEKPPDDNIQDIDEMFPEDDLGILCEDDRDLGELVDECEELYDPELVEDIFDDLEEFLFGEKKKRPAPEPGADEPKSRKRKIRHEEAWKRNQRKIKREAGEEYVSARGKIVQAKTLMTKKDCLNNCKYNCSAFIDEKRRREIFVAFYRLPTNAKYQYILNTTEQIPVKDPQLEHRKQHNYLFWFYIDKKAVKVCKVFYLTTLNVSAKVIYGCHDRKQAITEMVGDCRGKHGRHKKFSDDAKNLIKEHIRSFPIVNSHYCSNSQRQFLDPGLTISKMYKLYEELCDVACITPLNMKMYNKIFNEEFSLQFSLPKKKRCDLCTCYEQAKQEKRIDADLIKDYSEHEIEKNILKKERDKERHTNEAVLSFDLQNVLCCPKVDITNFYYKSKLNVYILTAHLSKGNQVYCVIWNEILADDHGNDLASVISMLLEKVYTSNKYLTSLIIWSETCLVKNRNPIMSFAILDFLRKHESFKSITMKYSIPGHTAIQEVYNIQAGITNIITSTEFYSPVTLIDMIKNLRRKKPYHIIQLTKEDVKSFRRCSMYMNYEQVPFNEALNLVFTNSFTVQFKRKYSAQLETADVTPEAGTVVVDKGCLKIIQCVNDIPEPIILGLPINFPEEKVDSIRSMYDTMPKKDMEYFEFWFKEIGFPEDIYEYVEPATTTATSTTATATTKTATASKNAALTKNIKAYPKNRAIPKKALATVTKTTYPYTKCIIPFNIDTNNTPPSKTATINTAASAVNTPTIPTTTIMTASTINTAPTINTTATTTAPTSITATTITTPTTSNTTPTTSNTTPITSNTTLSTSNTTPPTTSTPSATNTAVPTTTYTTPPTTTDTTPTTTDTIATTATNTTTTADTTSTATKPLRRSTRTRSTRATSPKRSPTPPVVLRRSTRRTAVMKSPRTPPLPTRRSTPRRGRGRGKRF